MASDAEMQVHNKPVFVHLDEIKLILCARAQNYTFMCTRVHLHAYLYTRCTINLHLCARAHNNTYLCASVIPAEFSKDIVK